jgi:hypothetical protein
MNDKETKRENNTKKPKRKTNVRLTGKSFVIQAERVCPIMHSEARPFSVRQTKQH